MTVRTGGQNAGDDEAHVPRLIDQIGLVRAPEGVGVGEREDRRRDDVAGADPRAHERGVGGRGDREAVGEDDQRKRAPRRERPADVDPRGVAGDRVADDRRDRTRHAADPGQATVRLWSVYLTTISPTPYGAEARRRSGAGAGIGRRERLARGEHHEHEQTSDDRPGHARRLHHVIEVGRRPRAGRRWPVPGARCPVACAGARGLSWQPVGHACAEIGARDRRPAGRAGGRARPPAPVRTPAAPGRYGRVLCRSRRPLPPRVRLPALDADRARGPPRPAGPARGGRRVCAGAGARGPGSLRASGGVRGRRRRPRPGARAFRAATSAGPARAPRRRPRVHRRLGRREL